MLDFQDATNRPHDSPIPIEKYCVKCLKETFKYADEDTNKSSFVCPKCKGLQAPTRKRCACYVLQSVVGMAKYATACPCHIKRIGCEIAEADQDAVACQCSRRTRTALVGIRWQCSVASARHRETAIRPAAVFKHRLNDIMDRDWTNKTSRNICDLYRQNRSIVQRYPEHMRATSVYN